MGETSRRATFLRHAGSIGLSGAATLGFSLADLMSAHAAPPPRDVIAAGGGATIHIGMVDSFSGVYTMSGGAQRIGIECALEDAMKRNSRVKYILQSRDDEGKPAVGEAAASRLIMDRVDVLIGTVSSGVALAVSAVAEDAGVLYISSGAADTNVTGKKANRVTFRQTCSGRMLARAMAPALLVYGKKWHFITADYSFGHDAQDRLETILAANGGVVVGSSIHPLGMADFTNFMQANVLYSSADVLVFCNNGPDTVQSVKAAVDLGLHRRMHIGGLVGEDGFAAQMPLDEIAGSTWGYNWGRDAGGATSTALSDRLRQRTPDAYWRHYVGYMSAKNYVDVLEQTGTTRTESLVDALEGYHYDAAKVQTAYFRKCDHQAVQQTYAAVIAPNPKRLQTRELFKIVSSIGGEFAAESCSNPDSLAASAIFASQRIPQRKNYAPVRLR